jgi:hypothetical protein
MDGGETRLSEQVTARIIKVLPDNSALIEVSGTGRMKTLKERTFAGEGQATVRRSRWGVPLAVPGAWNKSSIVPEHESHQSGSVLSGFELHADPPPISRLLAALSVAQLPSKPVRFGDRWRTTLKDSSLPDVVANVDTDFVTPPKSERLLGRPTWRLRQTGTAAFIPGEQPLTVTGEFWLDASDGQLLHSVVEVEHLDTLLGNFHLHVTTERVPSAPLLEPKGRSK